MCSRVWCREVLGANSSGQLGNGVSGYSAGSNVPVAVSNADSGISAISTGDTHACAVDSGAVKCWGSNGSGQLGNGLKSYSATNTLVSVSGVSSGVTALSLGYSHSCAVTTTALKCWEVIHTASLVHQRLLLRK